MLWYVHQGADLAYVLSPMQVQIFFKPVYQMFRLDDRSRQYPHAEIERVSSLQNVLFAGVGPLVFLVIWAIIARPGVHKAHVTILGLLTTIFLTLLLTDIVKNAVGRPRPDLIARCEPRAGTPEHDLLTIDVCTAPPGHTLYDGWRSFPSGHSSWAFAGLGYLSLFLAGQMHVFRPHVDLLRILVFLTPLCCAALVALSRVADYRHDVYDVTCGSLLGMGVAYAIYRRYYRPLSHHRCDMPYPNRADYEMVRFAKSKPRDVEQQLQAEEFEMSASDPSDDESRSYLLTQPDPVEGREHGGSAEPP